MEDATHGYSEYPERGGARRNTGKEGRKVDFPADAPDIPCPNGKKLVYYI